MRVNNFKELEKEIIQTREHKIQNVKNDLTTTRSLFQLMGDLLDLYIPRFFGSVLGSHRGSVSEDHSSKSKYPHES